MTTTTYLVQLVNAVDPSDSMQVEVVLTSHEIMRHGSFLKLYLVAREYRRQQRAQHQKRMVTRRVFVLGPHGARRELRFAVPDRQARWLYPFDVLHGQMPAMWPSFSLNGGGL